MRALLAAAAILFLTLPSLAQDYRTGEVPSTVAPSLWRHTAEFNREVIEVTDGVYVAVGFALANSIMVEGDDGIVIIDVTETVEEGQRVLAGYRRELQNFLDYQDQLRAYNERELEELDPRTAGATRVEHERTDAIRRIGRRLPCERQFDHRPVLY